jgi:site-specific DNA recombinase
MSRTTPPKPETPTIRCAIYTRKSTEEGLDQDFNTLDAQREAAEAFIKSQKQEGWQCLPETYDDGGYSGGNLERPAFKRLMADIEAGKVNCVIVYKVDRLSRSLLDFARIMEIFDRHQVAFVSVTQQFNTSTPMGRLVLNVLLSFAQFEREIIGERIRDKIAAQRRKGKWAGGAPVLGYDVDRTNRSPRLMVNTAEARLADPGGPGARKPWLGEQVLGHEEGHRPRRPSIRQSQCLCVAHQPDLYGPH